ncbi:MAG: hypothetical protein KJ727_09480, partial [Acidobacteria bacterium]|nr:hypothetical protein [Acidobacteriota bacterium]
TYELVIKQKIQLRLLIKLNCEIALKEEISKKNIEGIVVLDNYNIRSDLKDNGLLQRALKDWTKVKDEYTTKLFLKTNILDDTFFRNYDQTAELVQRYRKNN